MGSGRPMTQVHKFKFMMGHGADLTPSSDPVITLWAAMKISKEPIERRWMSGIVFLVMAMRC